jgi:hypothetical protein
LTGKAPYKFESGFLLRGITCEPELSVSAHHHSRHRVRIGDIWRQDKGSPIVQLSGDVETRPKRHRAVGTDRASHRYHPPIKRAQKEVDPLRWARCGRRQFALSKPVKGAILLCASRAQVSASDSNPTSGDARIAA